MLGAFETSRHLMDSAARLSLRNVVLERLLGLFNGALEAVRLYNDILDIAMNAVPCEAASIFIAGKKGELTVTAARGKVGDKLVGLTLKRGQGIAGACLLDRRMIPVSDVKSDPRHAAEVASRLGFETRSLLAAPILVHGAALGVIEIINKMGNNQFQRHDLDLMDRVCRTAGDVLSLVPAGGKAKGRGKKA